MGRLGRNLLMNLQAESAGITLIDMNLLSRTTKTEIVSISI